MAGAVDVIYPLRYSIGFFVIHKYLLPLWRPESLKAKKYSSFDNISISLIHSVITAIGALVCVWNDLNITRRLDLYNTDFTIAIIKFSYAYFVYDMFDMLRMNNWNPL